VGEKEKGRNKRGRGKEGGAEENKHHYAIWYLDGLLLGKTNKRKKTPKKEKKEKKKKKTNPIITKTKVLCRRPLGHNFSRPLRTGRTSTT